MARVQKPSLIRNLLISIGVILLIIAANSYFKNKKIEKVNSSLMPEEIIFQEEGAVRKTGEEEEVLSEEEISRVKEEIDSVLSTGGETINLNDVFGSGADGKIETGFSDGKFYCKITAFGLRAVEKGYYYEGWLKNEENLSIGRMEVNLFNEGVLYYTASINRSDYDQVMITLEPEDGNEEPARKILEGNF